MGDADPRNGYFEARYPIGPEKYATVKDDNRKVKRFTSKRAAENAAAAVDIEYASGAVAISTAIASASTASTRKSGGLTFYDYGPG
ncbi:hypothetical protein [Nocardia terpenica]|uniref:Uncharacterized protein n=1 Tax=Nocardia terpenica TaxID=455432 RepID=A0A164NU54_9NOCA|nr:hypothetical protein [Nocardia terpenica]KZM74728.1 hypothetical protein AWN90_21995 [Nocardia terpenica]NQE93651.1 hypothetical protein [Nocardia terpenica]